MSALKATPGPWTAEGESIWCTLENRAVVEIARANVLEELHATWAYANANLIAAAPDLYTELEHARELLAIKGVFVDAIDNALAKARGEQVPA